MDPVTVGLSAGGSLGTLYILSRIIERLIDKRNNGQGSIEQMNTLAMLTALNDIKSNTALLVEQQKGMFSALRLVCTYREKEG